ncbi:hypothetical protein Ddc_06408 [Ditylenchus destructor]|nr:hypothetical protein Ddc_06408 [Ditylenchus destructor]
MKIYVSYNNQREGFENVERMTYGEFKQVVTDRFNIPHLGSFELLLGQTVLRLELNQHFSELPDDSRIVSGDLLYLRHTATTAPEPMDTNQSSTSSMQVNPPSTVNSDIRTATDISSNQPVPFPDENVPNFFIQRVKIFLKRYGFEKVDETLLPSEREPVHALLECSHKHSLSRVRLTMNFFRDDPSAPDKITSVLGNSMIITSHGKCFIQATDIIEKNPEGNISSEIESSLLMPVKVRLLGPDNPFLRFLGDTDLVDRAFRFVRPRDLLNVEQACSYAKWKCRSSPVIDRVVWKPLLGDEVPDQLNEGETYRELYQKRVAELHRIAGQTRPIIVFQPPNPHFYDDFFRPWSPQYQPPMNQPTPHPLDPYYGGLILPQRQPRQPFQPRVLPHQPIWDDPNAPGSRRQDPDMPQGPQNDDPSIDMPFGFPQPFPPRRGNNGRRFGPGGGFGGGPWM